MTEVRILGRLEVVDGDRQVALPRGHARVLLGLLALRAGEVVSSERLIDQLWGPMPPPTADKALHGLVSILRKRLEPDRDRGAPAKVLQTRPPGYVLTIDRHQVDAHRFRSLVEEAAGAPVATRAALLRDALGLWRGPALDDFTYEPFAQGPIADLEELRLTALEERVEADLARGRHAELVAELEGLTAEHSLRERLRGQLMLALYRAGRQAEALDVYRDARRALVDELGVEPASALQRLEQAILNHDPSLDAPVEAETQAAPEPAQTDAVRPWLVTGRKTVTVLFADLSQSSSTQNGEGVDPEATRPTVRRAYKAAVEMFKRHGGTVEGLIGDVVVAVFGLPVAHEDDAARAVRVAFELRGELEVVNAEAEREQGIRLAARFGINTGEVVVGDPTIGRTATSGPPVAVAARLQQTAGEGEVLIGESTRRLLGDAVLVEPVEERSLDGRGRPFAAWRVLDAVLDARALRPRLGSPMLGREAELARLHATLQRAARDARASLAVVLGEAGIGKSRLAVEFAASLGAEAEVLTGHCPPYGEGITFWPLREIVVEAAGGKDRDALLGKLGSVDDAEWIAEQVAGAVGLTETPGRPDELFPALRRFFEALARQHPLVVVVEDAHWAQPTLLDLLEYLVESVRGRVLLLCLARPEFAEQRPGWGESSHRGDALFLEPLGEDQAAQLIAARSPGRTLPPETALRVVEMAQGNPLFVEQMVVALRDEGELSIPPSVQALLVARLDRLGPAERDLIRAASVLGRHFAMSTLLALLPKEARPSADRHLEALQRKELLVPTGRSTFGGKGFGFRHVLIQRAAYGTITKDARAELHEQVAEWLEAEPGEEARAFEEVIGYHLERAHEYRRELGALDAHTHALAVRAGTRLAGAGIRAVARFDAVASQNLLSRADALLPADHRQRWEVRRRLAETYQVMGRPRDADAVLSELLQGIESDAGASVEHFLRLERARVRLATGPDPMSLDAIREDATQALAVFEAVGDESGLAQAHFLLALIHLRLGRPTEMEEVARRGLAHANRSGNAREELGARWLAAMALEPGPRPVHDCILACEDLLRWRGTEHPGVLSDLAYLRSMLGEFDEARELIAHARRLLAERIRARRPLGQVLRRAAGIEILADDLESAERELRKALEVNTDMEERDPISQITAILSRILTMRGNTGEAARLAGISEDHAPSESVAAQALWRAASARVLASRGEPREAEALAREAVELAPAEMLNLRADLGVDLAEILVATGQQDQAQTLFRGAGDLYKRKGNIVGARRALSRCGLD